MGENIAYKIPEQHHHDVIAQKTKHNDLVRKLSKLRMNVSIAETELSLESQKYSEFIREIIPELGTSAFSTKFDTFEIIEESAPPFIFY